MKVAIFGATGMVGQSAIRECLLDAHVAAVLCVGRTPTRVQHPKLKDIQTSDLWNLSNHEQALTGIDACFFCMGVSTTGVNEAEFKRLNYDLPLSIANTLARLNPGKMTFIYVSGAGTDSTEKGRVMWARVKGATENALLRLPFKAAYMFRPGIIQPMNGVCSKTPAYRLGYFFLKPVLPVVKAIFPEKVLTSEQVGRAMIAVSKHGPEKRLLEPADLYLLGTRGTL